MLNYTFCAKLFFIYEGNCKCQLKRTAGVRRNPTYLFVYTRKATLNTQLSMGFYVPQTTNDREIAFSVSRPHQFAGISVESITNAPLSYFSTLRCFSESTRFSLTTNNSSHPRNALFNKAPTEKGKTALKDWVSKECQAPWGFREQCDCCELNNWVTLKTNWQNLTYCHFKLSYLQHVAPVSPK
jgi:hypothetical protein